MKKTFYSVAGITLIILYWVFYYWQESLAQIGDYRYFSYHVNELYPIGTILIPIFTLYWLVLHIRSIIKNKSWKKELLLLTVLVFLTCGQLGLIYRLSKQINVTCVATVKEKLSDNYIVIRCGEDEVTLFTTPSVVNLLKTDGTEYCFSYETYKDSREKGTLCIVVTDSSED